MGTDLITNIASSKSKLTSSPSLGSYYSGIIIGRVLEIELEDPSQLGVIKYEPLFGSDSATSPAKPLSLNFKHYPVKDEIVCIITGPSYNLNDRSTAQDKYYFPPYGVWSTNHHNTFPNLYEYSQKVNQNTPSVEDTQQGIPNTSVSQALRSTVVEKENIHTLRPYPGDTILESRWGSSIRFGSSGQEGSNVWSGQGSIPGDPITIISNGHGAQTANNWDLIVEDISKDSSAIWITSTQEISVKDITQNFSLESFKSQTGIDQKDLLQIPTLPISYTALAKAQIDRMQAPTLPVSYTSK